jgi:hypothetical protein
MLHHIAKDAERGGDLHWLGMGSGRGAENCGKGCGSDEK